MLQQMDGCPLRLKGLSGCLKSHQLDRICSLHPPLYSASLQSWLVKMVFLELQRVCWCVQRQCLEHSVVSSEVGFEMLFCTTVARTAHLGIPVSPGCVQSHCHTTLRLGHFGDVLNITGSGCNKVPGKKEVRYTLCSLEIPL